MRLVKGLYTLLIFLGLVMVYHYQAGASKTIQVPARLEAAIEAKIPAATVNRPQLLIEKLSNP